MKNTTKELRTLVKNILIAQGGKAYGFNHNTLCAAGYNTTDIQNAFNYFKYSKTQAKLRAELGIE